MGAWRENHWFCRAIKGIPVDDQFEFIVFLLSKLSEPKRALGDVAS